MTDGRLTELGPQEGTIAQDEALTTYLWVFEDESMAEGDVTDIDQVQVSPRFRTDGCQILIDLE